MVKIEYSQDAQEDIVRLALFLLKVSPTSSNDLFDVIDDGIMILSRHPNVGRLVTESGLRELVISHGKSGYIALYKFDELTESIMVVAIKHQREDEFH